MTIIYEFQTVIICDKCGERENEALVFQRQAIKELRAAGWSFGKKVLCPKCKGKVQGEVNV